MAEVASPPVEFKLDERKMDFIVKTFLSRFKFRLMLTKMLPMGFLSGMRIDAFDRQACTVSLKYKWLNKNPFRSTFWAVMGMAAEMSSGALLMQYTHGQKPSVATLLVGQDSKYYKKAVGRTSYVCKSGDEMRATVERAYATGEGQTITCPVEAFNAAGELIAEFTFVWSMKVRKKK